MKPLILIAVDGDIQMIEVKDYRHTLLCEILCTEEINVPDSFKFELEEVEQFILIAKNFRLFYNNLSGNKITTPIFNQYENQ
ncbi:MAG: hypothetical protein ABI091_26880 [Ferruginibacter sp.]